VAVTDSGLDSGDMDDMHPDIAGRVKALLFYSEEGVLEDAADEHGHGTHVAGIIAGNGATGDTDENGYLYGLGVAPGAKLVAQRIFDAVGNYTAPEGFDYETLTRDATQSGAEIGSNSWGDDTQGYYDASAAAFDELVRDADRLRAGEQPYILEFSAGNTGPPYQTVGSPAVGKNVIATGASENNRFNLPEELPLYADGQEAMADFSSRGPCADGRIKPDVTAPGTWIASLASSLAGDVNAWPADTGSPWYIYMGGTSQAGPHASGAAAVFVQYYRSTHGGATPSPALVKAALINSATDMDDGWGTDPVPNADEGWGRLDLPALIGSDRSYELIEQTNLLSTGQVYERRVVVGSSAAMFKVTLAYTDVPGSPAASRALVNDLDLEVVGPDGHVYRGNQFEEGESVPDPAGRDDINNVEAVHLYEPVPGEYVVRVRAVRVVQGVHADTPSVIAQDFALVISALIPPPGTGILTFDRPSYTVPGAIKLSLIDQDLAGQTNVSVLLRSTTENNGETITLRASGGTGLFTGSVATATGPAVADGKLQFAHGDTIEAIYEDAHPAATRVAVARGDLQAPEIFSVIVTQRFGQVSISWDTDEDTAATVYYGTNLLNLSMSDNYLDTSHELRLTNAVPDVAYLFMVVSEDAAGNRVTNNNGGAYFSFTLIKPSTVLLVDDYHDDLFEIPPLTGYTAALDRVGVGYDVWDTAMDGTPTVNDLRPYRCVIWRVTEFSIWGIFGGVPTLSVQKVQAITNYLNQGGSLLIASMELLSRMAADYPSLPFNRNVLGVQSFGVDDGVSQIQGLPSEQVGAGLDVTLDFTPYADPSKEDYEMPADVSDTVVAATNALPIVSDGGGSYVGVKSPKPGVDRPGRVVYLSFPLDAVPLGTGVGNNRAGLLASILNFLAPPEGTSALGLDSDAYTLPSRVTTELEVPSLAGQGPLTVRFFSPEATNGVAVSVTETVRRGVFRGTVFVVSNLSGAGAELLARSGDTIRAQYTDAASGQTVTATALIDTMPPAITNITCEPEYVDAYVMWETSKAADSLVQYGEAPGSFPINFVAYDGQFDTYHEVMLEGLRPNKTYYYRVISRDHAGNVSVDDNGGAYYSFTTLLPYLPPWQDDMEHGRGDWYVGGDPDSDFQWALGVPGSGVPAHSPPTCWGSHLEGGVYNGDYGADIYLLSPPIYLTGGTRATLHFYHEYEFNPIEMDVYEYGELLLYTNASAYVVLDQGVPLLPQFTDYSLGWEEVTVNLTPHMGQVVYVGWHYFLVNYSEESPDVPGWLLDDVSVTVSDVASGAVCVTNNLSQALFALTGPKSTNGAGNFFLMTNAAPGQYVVEFGPVPYYNTPPKQTNTLVSSTTLTFQGNYTFTDANHNGLPDQWEQDYFGGLLPPGGEGGDKEGDGVSNLAEFAAGTNPANSNSCLRLTLVGPFADGTARFEWTSAAGRSYRLMRCNDLQNWAAFTEWERIASVGPVSRTLPVATGGPTQLFRLEVRP
jgi:hypothetical protein